MVVKAARFITIISTPSKGSNLKNLEEMAGGVASKSQGRRFKPFCNTLPLHSDPV